MWHLKVIASQECICQLWHVAFKNQRLCFSRQLKYSSAICFHFESCLSVFRSPNIYYKSMAWQTCCILQYLLTKWLLTSYVSSLYNLPCKLPDMMSCQMVLQKTEVLTKVKVMSQNSSGLIWWKSHCWKKELATDNLVIGTDQKDIIRAITLCKVPRSVMGWTTHGTKIKAGIII